MKFRYWLVCDPTRPSDEVERDVPTIMRRQLKRQLNASGEREYWQVHYPDSIPVAVFGDFDHPDLEPIHLVWGLSPDNKAEVLKYRRRFRELDGQLAPDLQVLFDGCLAILASLERIPVGVDLPIIEDLAQEELVWRRQVALWLAQKRNRTLWDLTLETIRRAYRSVLEMSREEKLQRAQMLYEELRRRIDGD